MFNVVEFYCGLGCFIDSAGRSGCLGWGAGVESDPEIAKAFASYARGNGNIDTFVAKVESVLGLPGHVVEHGGDAQRFLDALKTKPVDVLAGSPLCEGFSSLNAHSSGDAARLKRNHLKYWGQAVMKLQPEYAVMENVPEVMSPKYKQNLSTLLLQLAGCGYQLQCYVLSSWAFGAGSDRERFVLLATRLGTPLPPNLQPFHAKKNVHQHDRGVRWAFASKRAWTGADSREKARLPRCVTLADVLETLGPPDVPPRKAHVAGNLHSARIESVRVQSLMDGVPTTLNACYATIPKSIRAANAVPRYEKNLTTTGKLGYRRLQSNSPARSPTKKSSPEGMQGCVMHPTESRVCTPAENLCAMGFACNRSHQIRQYAVEND
jgi:DNA (cytosine-5)-methyltransferase 1